MEGVTVDEGAGDRKTELGVLVPHDLEVVAGVALIGLLDRVNGRQVVAEPCLQIQLTDGLDGREAVAGVGRVRDVGHAQDRLVGLRTQDATGLQAAPVLGAGLGRHALDLDEFDALGAAGEQDGEQERNGRNQLGHVSPFEGRLF